MKIHGFQKLTLLDYPGKVACTIFTGGCNFRCPFCHNGNLVLHPGEEPEIPKEQILNVLKKRRGILEGVCITGGEPTLAVDLAEWIREIRGFGYLVKLDTNGYRPEVLESLISEGLLDFVAMDIKNAPDSYSSTAGISNLDFSRIERSVQSLKSGRVDYEFRTTVARELHGREEMDAIGRWIRGAKRYYLQNYRQSGQVIRPEFTGFTREELEDFRVLLKQYIPQVEIRGTDA